jgi:hypothetical protein
MIPTWSYICVYVFLMYKFIYIHDFPEVRDICIDEFAAMGMSSLKGTVRRELTGVESGTSR